MRPIHLAVQTVFALAILNPTAEANSAFTGRCGGLISVVNPYAAATRAQENSIDDDEGVSALFSINFDNRTLAITVDAFNYRNGESFQTLTEISGVSFSLSDYSLHFGAKKLAFAFPENDGGSLPIVMIMLPVNGGNSYLVQSAASTNFSGVCQKL
jgi:hypothetical protein